MQDAYEQIVVLDVSIKTISVNPRIEECVTSANMGILLLMAQCQYGWIIDVMPKLNPKIIQKLETKLMKQKR